jgi:hypothetical protein
MDSVTAPNDIYADLRFAWSKSMSADLRSFAYGHQAYQSSGILVLARPLVAAEA